MERKERKQRIKDQNAARRGQREQRPEMTRAEYEAFVEIVSMMVAGVMYIAGVDPRGPEMARVAEIEAELRNDYVN